MHPPVPFKFASTHAGRYMHGPEFDEITRQSVENLFVNL